MKPKGKEKPAPTPAAGVFASPKCERCGTVWHSSQRRVGDRCNAAPVLAKRGDAGKFCSGICR